MTSNPRTPGRFVLLGTALLVTLAGCSGTTTPQTSPSTPSVTATPTPSATPSASRTLSAKDKAVAQATDAVMAYRQTFVDIAAAKKPHLDDLHDVGADPQKSKDLTTLQKYLVAGGRAKPGGTVKLVSAKPRTVKLKDKPPTVVLRVCTDSTSVIWIDKPGMKDDPGERELLDYTVIKTDYLPGPGWAVSDVRSPNGTGKAAKC